MKGLHGILLSTVRPVCLLLNGKKNEKAKNSPKNHKENNSQTSMIFLSMNSDGKD